MSKKRNDPKIVSIFRSEYPNSIYLDMYDNGLKIDNKRKPSDSKWVLKNMKLYHRINQKKKQYKKKEVKGLLKFA